MQVPCLAPLLAAWVLACGMFGASPIYASKWTVSSKNSLVLDTSNVSVSEMSGVTYVGPSPTPGKERFLTVQDGGGLLITVDVEFAADGSLVSALAVDDLQLSQSLDFEGVAYTNPVRDTVFLSYEEDPGLQEYRLSDGVLEQSVAIPAVFATRRNNRGFESLARNPAGTLMWTANEEALTVDGDVADATEGTIVRLLRLNVSGNDVTSAQQFAYEVDPIHTSGFAGQRRSGLSDLVLLPDDTLLALERSFDVSLSDPPYETRIYEVDPTGAADVSVAPYDDGLLEQSYSAITNEQGKTLLWAGQTGSSNGQNLEGLTLGPRLASGVWVMLGVVDNSNGSDPFSENTLASFLLSPNLSADFDEDGDVDGNDFLALQRGYGTPIGAQHAQGDADRDGDVDDDDLNLWETSFATLAAVVPQTVPETSTALLAFFAVPLLSCRLFR